MPIDFPNSPTNGDLYSAGGKNWQYNGSAWVLLGIVPSIPVGSVGTSELADNAVTTAKIAAGAVVEADLATGAVTADKISSSAVTTAKIADDSITTAKIAAGAVVEVDIASNAVTTGKLGTDVQLGYRNVLINGAMQVHQRGTSTAGITSNSYRTADRWKISPASFGTWTNTIENDAPTGSGFRKSFKITCTSTQTNPTGMAEINVQQILEGQNLQQFLKGTASAKPFTVSFWVKSTTTGTYILELYDWNNLRQVSAAYTISASNTWERKVITLPADTTGAFTNDNGLSLYFVFWCGAGTSLTSGTLNTTWASATNANRVVGQVNLGAAVNNSWQVTGVQLEAGSVATPFEFEDYGTTLAKCQRYYQRFTSSSGGPGIFAMGMFGGGTSASRNILPFQVPMRALASSVDFSAANTFWLNAHNIANYNVSAIGFSGYGGSTADALEIHATPSSSAGAAGTAALLVAANATAFIGVSAEL